MFDSASLAPPIPQSDAVVFPAGSATAAGARTLVSAPVRLSNDQVRLAQLLRRGCTLALPGLQAQFSIRAAGHAAGERGDTLFLETPSGQIDIDGGARLIMALTGIHPGSLQTSSGGYRQWLASALAGRLEGTPFEGARIVPPAAPLSPENTVCLRIALRSRNHLVTALARASVATWLDFLPRSDWTPLRAPASTFLSTEIRQSVRVAQHVLPAGVLRTLSAGDVIVPDSAFFQPDGQGRIQLGQLGLLVRYAAPNALEILSVEGSAVDAEPPDAADEAIDDAHQDDLDDESQYE